MGRLRDPGWLRTPLDLRVSAAAGTVVFDCFAPYATGDGHSVTFWTNVVEWRVERSHSGTTLQSFDLEWPVDRELALRFRSSAESGDDPHSLVVHFLHLRHKAVADSADPSSLDPKKGVLGPATSTAPGGAKTNREGGSPREHGGPRNRR